MGFEYAFYFTVKSMVLGFYFLIGNRIGIKLEIINPKTNVLKQIDRSNLYLIDINVI
jgi:hypothetical protein